MTMKNIEVKGSAGNIESIDGMSWSPKVTIGHRPYDKRELFQKRSSKWLIRSHYAGDNCDNCAGDRFGHIVWISRFYHHNLQSVANFGLLTSVWSNHKYWQDLYIDSLSALFHCWVEKEKIPWLNLSASGRSLSQDKGACLCSQ